MPWSSSAMAKAAPGSLCCLRPHEMLAEHWAGPLWNRAARGLHWGSGAESSPPRGSCDLI
jgi:hypothetical protein